MTAVSKPGDLPVEDPTTLDKNRSCAELICDLRKERTLVRVDFKVTQ